MLAWTWSCHSQIKKVTIKLKKMLETKSSYKDGVQFIRFCLHLYWHTGSNLTNSQRPITLIWFEKYKSLSLDTGMNLIVSFTEQKKYNLRSLLNWKLARGKGQLQRRCAIYSNEKYKSLGTVESSLRNSNAVMWMPLRNVEPDNGKAR